MKARYEAMFMVHKNIDAAQNRGQTKTSQHTAVITIEHLLDAAMRERGSIIAQILEKKSSTRSISPTQARPIKTQARKETNIEIILHDIVAKTIIKAVQISQQYSHWYVGTEHLLKAILVCAPKQFSEWMRKNNITVHNIEKNIQVILESTSKFPDITAIFRDEDIDIKTDKKNINLSNHIYSPVDNFHKIDLSLDCGKAQILVPRVIAAKEIKIIKDILDSLANE